MRLEHYVRKGTKNLRYGYTTGTCAALAAYAATRILLEGRVPEKVSLMTSKEIPVDVQVEKWGTDKDGAWAGIAKDAGDDSDVTDGMLICAKSMRIGEDEGEGGPARIEIDGGEGIGRVTREGLDQPVGEAAINSGPRKMIEEQVRRACEEASYEGGIRITVFAPEGEEAAKQTFNENLGIEGGISILGTTGIVEPMSEQALVDTIELEMRQDGLETKNLIMTPGNYGYHYIQDRGIHRLKDDMGKVIPVLKFSNFLGESLDMLKSCGIEKVLIIAHGGKLVKVAGGVMNTHSSYADCRREIICAHCALSGGDLDTCRRMMDAATTDACFDILDEKNLLDQVIDGIMKSIQSQLEHRVKGAAKIGAVMFSNTRGTLGMTPQAEEILESWSGMDLIDDIERR